MSKNQLVSHQELILSSIVRDTIFNKDTHKKRNNY